MKPLIRFFDENSRDGERRLGRNQRDESQRKSMMSPFLSSRVDEPPEGVMKPEESNSARDTLRRLEEELIKLEEHPLVIIESLRHRLPHPRVRGNLL
jgi:hypothetical protein